MKVQPSVYVYTHTLGGDVQGSIQNYLSSNRNVFKKASKVLIQQTKNKNKPQTTTGSCGIQREMDSRMANMDPKNSTKKMLTKGKFQTT